MGFWWLATSGLAWGEQEVLQVSLAPTIEFREPTDPFTPVAHCEKDQNGQDSVPIIEVSKLEKVFFWTRLYSSSDVIIRHSWHQEIKGRWHNLSEVDLM